MLLVALAFIVIGALLLSKGKRKQDSTTRIAGIILLVVGIVLILLALVFLVGGFSVLGIMLHNAMLESA